MIFAKHILCAAVADTESEIDNMWLIRHDMPYAQCVHHKPGITEFVSDSLIETVAAQVTTVELKQVGFFGDLIGRVGKCHKCGKIFYWIPNMPEIELRRERKRYHEYSCGSKKDR